MKVDPISIQFLMARGTKRCFVGTSVSLSSDPGLGFRGGWGKDKRRSSNSCHESSGAMRPQARASLRAVALALLVGSASGFYSSKVGPLRSCSFAAQQRASDVPRASKSGMRTNGPRTAVRMVADVPAIDDRVKAVMEAEAKEKAQSEAMSRQGRFLCTFV